MQDQTHDTADHVTPPLPENFPTCSFTIEDMYQKTRTLRTTDDRMRDINDEFRRAFDFIKDHPRSITIFGSARFTENDHYYQQARRVAGRVAQELGYAVVTGGGPGIMEAANRGAFEVGGRSIGYGIDLPKEQAINEYVTASIDFHYFFSRKVALSFAAEAYIFFPGGFGTMDEFFEIVTLVQTHKIPRIPIILVGSEYWNPLNTFIFNHLYNEHRAIDETDVCLYVTVDHDDEILEIIKGAPVRS